MDDRVEQRQAIADRIRLEHRQSTRRKRVMTSVFVVVGVLACAAALLWIPFQAASDDSVVEPENATDTFGFTVTPELVSGDTSNDSPIPVSLYEDFLCPSCSVFHNESGAFLSEQIASGTISLTYHPFTFLLENSTDEYTQRAANAAVCVGDDAGALAYAKMHDLLMQNQPEQGGAGLTDEQLVEYGVEAGAEDIADCVEDRTFTPWVEEALAAGQKAGITTTPTVQVAGKTVVRSTDGRESMPGPAEIEFAIEASQ